MNLKTWIKREGRGAKTRLARQAEVSPETVRRAISGELTKEDLADRIAQITGAAPRSMLSAAARSSSKLAGKDLATRSKKTA